MRILKFLGIQPKNYLFFFRKKLGIFIRKLYLFTDYVKRKCQIVSFFSIWRVSVDSIEFQSPKFDAGDYHGDAGHHHFFEIIPGLLPDVISMERYTAFMFIICSKFKNISDFSDIVLYTYDVIIM